MNFDNLIDSIKTHEGFRSRVYKDSVGIDTIGYGFTIEDLELTESISSLILSNKLWELYFRIDKKFDWFKNMPDSIRNVIMEMCYQLGLRGFSRFKKTIGYFKAKQWSKASIEMLDSKWFRKDSPSRAQALSRIVANVI